MEKDNLNIFEMGKTLFDAWSKFAKCAGIEPGNYVTFGDLMNTLYLVKKHTNRGDSYRGIALKLAPLTSE